jgi:hypothetical protein
MLSGSVQTGARSRTGLLNLPSPAAALNSIPAAALNWIPLAGRKPIPPAALKYYLAAVVRLRFPSPCKCGNINSARPDQVLRSQQVTNLGFRRSVTQLSQSAVFGRASNRQFEFPADEGTCPVRLVAAPSVRAPRERRRERPCHLHPLGPFLRFVDDELAEVGGGTASSVLPSVAKRALMLRSVNAALISRLSWVGGSNQTVALQPVSVQGQVGLNLAVGFAEYNFPGELSGGRRSCRHYRRRRCDSATSCRREHLKGRR